MRLAASTVATSIPDTLTLEMNSPFRAAMSKTLPFQAAEVVPIKNAAIMERESMAGSEQGGDTCGDEWAMDQAPNLVEICVNAVW
mmetsp:Transcript_13801/g.19159  ORF Transcript_13801/g.19159 Transcript_13801/m.19159 type:complete len:85 (-) Transcript_13801:6-260(-)